ncbi:hypothetical protein F5X99DRAFT_366641 [Biscogniauxia marginata]|nr:hypothetical protein F5X99DRAFT_366641 [Biscogniauxia marginata]
MVNWAGSFLFTPAILFFFFSTTRSLYFVELFYLYTPTLHLALIDLTSQADGIEPCGDLYSQGLADRLGMSSTREICR